MTQHNVATREEWQHARDELLVKEKELTRRNDELARERRELPWVLVDKEYRFDTEAGTKDLAALFDGRSQLVVYHFMFGAQYAAGCPVCSSAADAFNGTVEHLKARDVTFTCVSHAPLEKLLAYRERMGWSFPWASSADSDFNYDFGVSYTAAQIEQFLQGELGPLPTIAADCGTDPAGFLEEGPGLSSFVLADGAVYHTYSTYQRGLEVLMGYYPLLDRTAKGRDEGSPPELWMRRHDEYGTGRKD
jgi:predicted dithiol-disulfide oxidoreductase (DUF899 family)